ncbi:hypothetical protein [Pseudonocardia sp.]|uniref:hypothetical protein n=1 Tax=Pseudonocardia sp. TaxID=60912 RepID=UPI003D0E0292
MDRYGLATRAELVGAGFTDGELRRRRRDGRLHRVARGSYAAGDDPRVVDAAARHRLRVRAALRRAAPGAVASHASAALLHGLPTWGLPTSLVHLTRDRPGGGRRERLRHVHAAPLRPDEVTEVDGVAVTTVARTVVDLARTLAFEAAVVAADAALGAGLVSTASLAVAVGRAGGRRGGPAASRVVAFADGRSASVGESRSRVALHEAGLPAPRLQWEVRDSGRLLGRTDFGWPGQRVVGEFDGRVKYGRRGVPAISGEAPADVVWAEKRREDALRAAGLHVVRWTWADLTDFGPTAQRLRAVLRR